MNLEKLIIFKTTFIVLCRYIRTKKILQLLCLIFLSILIIGLYRLIPFIPQIVITRSLAVVFCGDFDNFEVFYINIFSCFNALMFSLTIYTGLNLYNMRYKAH